MVSSKTIIVCSLEQMVIIVVNGNLLSSSSWSLDAIACTNWGKACHEFRLMMLLMNCPAREKMHPKQQQQQQVDISTTNYSSRQLMLMLTLLMRNCVPNNNDAVVCLFLLGHHSDHVADIRVIAT
jgi:hypothetical protein